MTAALAPASRDDTIVAQSTAPGAAAIAIVRLSGPRALPIAESLAKAPLPAPYRLSRQRLCSPEGALLDEAMVVQMPAPHSYTGEDLVELHLHGGPAVCEAVQAACRKLGARAAEAGEFTHRAFLHGKMDLVDVEAIGALVHAESEAERRASVALLAGGLQARLRPLLASLMQVVALARATLDFPDDMGESAFPPSSRDVLRTAAEALKDMLAHREVVDQLKPEWVLRGPSNAGKSTLLNALVGYERALTDPAPGTTRDAVSVTLSDLGGRVVLWDTAGDNDDAQGVEARGIAMADAISKRANIIVWLLGPHVGWPPVRREHEDQSLWVVGSHADRFDAQKRRDVEQEAKARGHQFVGWLSVPTGEGLQALRDKFRAGLATDAGHARVALTARHAQALQQATQSLALAQQALARGGADDMALLDVEAALAALDTIFGQGVGPEVFEQIFQRFCIGK